MYLNILNIFNIIEFLRKMGPRLSCAGGSEATCAIGYHKVNASELHFTRAFQGYRT